MYTFNQEYKKKQLKKPNKKQKTKQNKQTNKTILGDKSCAQQSRR